MANLATLDFGISAMNDQRPGNCQWPNLAEQELAKLSGDGRSPNLSPGTPITAASTTSGCAIRRILQRDGDDHFTRFASLRDGVNPTVAGSARCTVDARGRKVVRADRS